MKIIQLCVIGLVAAGFSMLLKKERPEFTLLLTAGFAIAVLWLISGMLEELVSFLRRLTDAAGVNVFLMETVLKITGAAWILGMGARLTRDAGADSIAGWIEIGGRIIMLFMTLPIFNALLNLLLSLIRLPEG